MRITIMGATGRTGQLIANRLLDQGLHVRALGRSESKLSSLKNRGAEVMAGDLTDASYLTRAFENADAIYTLLPYDFSRANYLQSQTEKGEAITKAIQKSGVQRVVFLSSMGADQTSGVGMIGSLHDQESRLRNIPNIKVLFLRPGAFFENFYEALDLIKSQGIIADAYAPHVALPMVATQDIAQAAVRALQNSAEWNDGITIREVLGPRDLSYAEATQILGKAIGRPELEYVQLPYQEMAQALSEAGIAEDVAQLLMEMAQGINEGRVKSAHGRSSAGTSANASSTSFEDFAVQFAEAYAKLP